MTEMNDYMIDMFRSPILHLQIRNWEEKKSKLSKLMNSATLEYRNSVKTTFEYFVDGDNKHNEENLNKKVSEILSDEINAVLNSFQLSQGEVIQSWFQVEEEGMYHGVHNHGYGVSSVCYLEFNPEVHTPLILISPSNNLIDGSSEQYCPQNVNEGSIVFFPSVLNHYTIPNQTNIPRKILAFNLRIH